MGTSGSWRRSFCDETTLVVPRGHLHDVLRFLRDDPGCASASAQAGPAERFGVVYNLSSPTDNRRLFIKVLLDPLHLRDRPRSGPAVAHLDRPLARSRVDRAGGVRHVRNPLRRPSRPAPHIDLGDLSRPSPPQGLSPAWPRRTRTVPRRCAGQCVKEEATEARRVGKRWSNPGAPATKGQCRRDPGWIGGVTD